MPEHKSGRGSGPRTAARAQAALGWSGASPLSPVDVSGLLQVPGLAVWQWEVSTNRVDWNEGLLRLYGVGAPATNDINFLAFVYPEDRERVDAELVSYVAETASFSILRPDGQVRRILDRRVVHRGTAGAAVRLLGVNFDLTAEWQAQERAAAAEHRAGLASRIAGFVTWEIDAETLAIKGRSVQGPLSTGLSRPWRAFRLGWPPPPLPVPTNSRRLRGPPRSRHEDLLQRRPPPALSAG